MLLIFTVKNHKNQDSAGVPKTISQLTTSSYVLQVLLSRSCINVSSCINVRHYDTNFGHRHFLDNTLTPCLILHKCVLNYIFLIRTLVGHMTCISHMPTLFTLHVLDINLLSMKDPQSINLYKTIKIINTWVIKCEIK